MARIDGRLTACQGQGPQRLLADRVGFPGQGGFIDLQALAGDDDPVGRERLAGRRDDEVSRHQLGGYNRDGITVANNGRAGGEPAPQTLGRSLRPAVQKGVHPDQRHDRREQDQGFCVFFEKGIERPGSDQEPEHGVRGRIPYDTPPAGV